MKGARSMGDLAPGTKSYGSSAPRSAGQPIKPGLPYPPPDMQTTLARPVAGTGAHVPDRQDDRTYIRNGSLQDREAASCAPQRGSAEQRELASPEASTSAVPLGASDESTDLHVLSKDHPTQFGQHLLRSERARKKARLREQPGVSVEALQQELLEETDGLVPLGAIVARLANYGFESFGNLAETLPSLSSSERKSKIFDTALDVRRQLVKLLVLVRWSRAAPDLMMARNLVGLLRAHTIQANDATDALRKMQSELPGARLRKADLVSATDILGTGKYQRLPSHIKDYIVPPRELTDRQALDVISDMDAALRTRLTLSEVVPSPLTCYSIEDGRVTFEVAKLFAASMTLSGNSPEDRWFLLSAKFDFRITGVGADLFPRRPRKRARTILISQADFELAPRSVALASEEDGAAVAAAAVAGGRDAEQFEATHPAPGEQRDECQRRDAPLVRAYNFLQSQALEYQLDILHYQAVELARVGWAPTVSAGFEPILKAGDPRTLTVSYWRKNRSERAGTASRGSAKAAKPVLDPLAGASIKIRAVDRSRRPAKLVALDRALCKDLSAIEAVPGQKLKQQDLVVEWALDPALREHMEDTQLVVNALDLDIEKLLRHAVSLHAAAAVAELRARLSASSLRAAVESPACSSTVTDEGGRSCHLLRLPLHPRLLVVLRIDTMSGRIQLEHSTAASTEAVASTPSNDGMFHRLKEASTQLNDDPTLLVEILQQQRALAILEGFEQKASFLGLHCTRRLPIRSTEYTRLGPETSLLFLPLPQCPNYYVVLRIGDDSVKVGLMCTTAFLDGFNTVLGVHSVEWLDRDRLAKGGALGKRKREEVETGGEPSSELSLEELSLLHHYSVALVCYHQIEQQLRVRGLPFVHVGSASEISSPPARAVALHLTRQDVAKDSTHASMVPSLCVRADHLLGASSSLVRRNVSIELRDWSDPLSCSVKFTVRLRRSLSTSSRKLVLNEATGDVLELESQQSALTFSTRSIDGCVALFLNAWDRVSRIMSLAREVASASRADKLDGLELRSFDLQQVVFAYEGGLTASVSLQDDPQTPRGSSYRLQLASSAGTSQPNPHEVIIDSLSRMLNGRFDGAPTFWPSFLQLLHDTLPYLRVVAPMMDQCLEDVLAPEPDVRSATWLRLTFIDSFVLDVRLLRGSKVLILDGATPLEPSTELQGHGSGSEFLENSSIEKPQDQSSSARRRSNGASHSAALLDGAVSKPIPSFPEILQAVMREFRQRKRTTEAAEAEQHGSTADPKVKFAKPTIRHTSDPAVIHLESGLVCDAMDHLVGPLLSAVIRKIKQRIASELDE